MQYSKIVEKVKAALGYPVVTVYTPDSSIEDAIDTGMSLLTGRALRTVDFILPANKENRLNPQEIQIVVDVRPFTGASNIIGALNVTGNSEEDFYSRSEFTLNELLTFYNYSEGGILQPVLANVMYSQMMDAFGAKFDWHYDSSTGILYCANVPSATQVLYVQAKVLHTYETLEPEKVVWLFEYALARTKQIEGRIRSKYSEGSIGAPSDGDTLLQEAATELQAATEKLESFTQLNYGVRR